MRTNYRIAEDLFIVIAFVAFGIASGTKLLGVQALLGDRITVGSLVRLSEICLLFSIALSLLDLSIKK